MSTTTTTTTSSSSSSNTINSDAFGTEDIASRPSPWRLLQQFVVTILKFVFVALGLGPPCFLLSCVYGRPPTLPRLEQLPRFVQVIWTADPPKPGITIHARIEITLQYLQVHCMGPFWGLCWLLDELLYGRELQEINSNQQVEFLLIVSAGRSGSTQLLRHLEPDTDRFVAPSILQSFFPYLWAWNIVPKIAAFFGWTQETIRDKFSHLIHDESNKRHPECDPFRGDTLDPSFCSFHGTFWGVHLGPTVAWQEFNFARHAPHHQAMWEQDFVTYVQRLGCKALLFDRQRNGTATTTPTKKSVLLKGHFLNAAPLLAAQLPASTKFLTSLRDPLAKIKSAVHFLRVQPVMNPGLGYVPWTWLAQWSAHMETEYGHAERAFFTSTVLSNPRCVVRFDDMIASPESTLQHVYQTLYQQPTLPPTILHDLHHKPNYQHGGYQCERSLEDLGLDPQQIVRDNADYIAWCQSIPSTARTTATLE